MAKIRIYVKDLKGKEVKIELDSSEKISFGKKLYANKINSFDSFQWKFNAMILNDDNTFEFYDINDEDRIISNNMNIQKIKVNIKNAKGRETQLLVNSSDKISLGKKLYANLVDSSDDLSWKYDGIILNDDKTFDYYKIDNEDLIISTTKN